MCCRTKIEGWSQSAESQPIVMPLDAPQRVRSVSSGEDLHDAAARRIGQTPPTGVAVPVKPSSQQQRYSPYVISQMCGLWCVVPLKQPYQLKAHLPRTPH